MAARILSATTRDRSEGDLVTKQKTVSRTKPPAESASEASGTAPQAHRHDRRRQRTRDALLQAAAELFEERGVNQATVAEIASRADVAHGSLYNHFSGVDEIISVLAQQSVQRMLDETGAIMSEVSDPRLLPCVGARLILRTFVRDVTIKWMLDRPYVFARTFQEVASPFMQRFESPGIERGLLDPAGGHAVWIRTLPWILIGELSLAIQDTPRKALVHEESFARICMRLLGIEDEHAEELLKQSLGLVRKHGY